MSAIEKSVLRGPWIHARQDSVVVLAHPGVALASCALELATIFDGDLATPFLDRTALHQIADNTRGTSALHARLTLLLKI